ncbi:MAG: ABC transporter permease [Myxococcota bacterium]
MRTLGRGAVELAGHVGGIALVFARTAARLPHRFDGREFLRSLHNFGNGSLPVVAATAAFTGVIMVLQGALYVQRFGVYDLVGWFTGFATFREIGPVLIGLMFSGRVGANNTSELATMRVNEQLTALEIMAIDVYELLVAPRFVAMMLSMAVLVVLGDGFAVASGALAARILLDLDFLAFWRS